VGACRSTNADASSRAIDPMTFQLVNVNQGSLYSNNGIVTISTSGCYYIYISAGASSGSVCTFASSINIGVEKNVFTVLLQSSVYSVKRSQAVSRITDRTVSQQILSN